eukprot:15467039-Alexandrium_andersonii.AAC.1
MLAFGEWVRYRRIWTPCLGNMAKPRMMPNAMLEAMVLPTAALGLTGAPTNEVMLATRKQQHAIPLIATAGQ